MLLNRKKGILISSFFLLFAFVFLGQVQYGFAAGVTLAWDPITQAELAGYKIYVGTSSRNYGTGIDVGNVTRYTVTALGPGTYYFAVTAYDVTGRETGYSNEVSETILSSDSTPPAVSITSPTSSPTYTTGSSSLGIGGSASDNVAVTQVTWANNRGGSGTATGTSSWSVTGIILQNGVNVITVTARDAAGNISTATLAVTYATLPPCSYSLSPSSASVVAPPSTGSIAVSAPSGCTWTATSGAGWITITSGGNGNGNGIVSYAVAANTSAGPRSGNLAVAGQSFTITQAKSSYDINGDGVVSALDLQILTNVILGLSACPGNCDINGDGSVNAMDLQLLINAITG